MRRTSKSEQRVGLGGGCHWCTEAVFQTLRGVYRVEQGFIGSKPPDDAFSEAVIVTFDPAVITLKHLLEIHLRTHASTSNHPMREKYRSAVYVFSRDQGRTARRLLADLQREFPSSLVTRVLPLVAFKETAQRYLNYYARNREGEFCERHIDPKLAKLRDAYPNLAKPEPKKRLTTKST